MRSRRTSLHSVILSLIALSLMYCGNPEAPGVTTEQNPTTVSELTTKLATTPPDLEWALVVHAGAGSTPRDLDPERKENYLAALRAALTLGEEMLDRGEDSLDVVEQVVRRMEDEPLFNAGKGAVFTHEGKNELDAAIMDGRDLACGAVAGLTSVKNPISLARKVMTESGHVLLVGSGAEQFATEMEVERVDSEYFFVQRRWDSLQRRLAEEEAAEPHGTVGVAVLDRNGNLAAGTSTGGMTNKRFGRVGDVPVIGAGTYANNRTVAISCTGKGEQFIRHNVAHDVSALIEYRGLDVQAAAEAVIDGKLEPGDGGLIAVSPNGTIAMVFNTDSMFRGAADSSGRFEVAIW